MLENNRGMRSRRLRREKATWRHVAVQLEQAAAGVDVVDLGIALRPPPPSAFHSPLGTREQVHSLCALGPGRAAHPPTPRPHGSQKPNEATHSGSPRRVILLGGLSFFAAGSAFLCGGFGSLREFRRWRELKRLLPQLWLSRSGLPLRQGARGTSNGSRLLSPKRQLQENRE